MIRSRGVCLMALGALAGCGSDAAGTDTTTTSPAVHMITAAVTGTTWTMTNVRATYLPASGTFILTGIDSLHTPVSEITFYLDAATVAAAYTPQNNSAMVVDFTRNDSTWDTLAGRIGNITFTTLSATRVAGSFNARVIPDPALNAADSAASLAIIGTFNVSIP
jgi:hypothetical protein